MILIIVLVVTEAGIFFSFVEEIEGIDFKGALKVLADKAGVTLLEVNPALRSEKNSSTKF